MIRVGIDLGGTKIEGIVLEPDGSERARLRLATPRDDYAATVEAVAALAERLAAGASEYTVGVGTPGTISPATGRMKNCNSTWLNGRDLQGDLARRLQRPLRLANDADCFALSEAADGAGAGRASVFGVILGTGVGGGLVLGGRVHRGPNAVAGEWGHNPLPWPEDAERPGPDCYCGRRGCIETWLSGPGLAGDFARVTGETAGAEEIAGRAARGDAPARAALDRHAHRLARSLATVINVLDPEIVVLGGGISNLEGLCGRVTRRWGEFVFSDRVDTRLEVARHGDASGVRGAARLGGDAASEAPG